MIYSLFPMQSTINIEKEHTSVTCYLKILQTYPSKAHGIDTLYLGLTHPRHKNDLFQIILRYHGRVTSHATYYVESVTLILMERSNIR